MAGTARRAISPYARRLARERGIALEQLRGSGPSGRIVAADILAFVPKPAVASVAAGGAQAAALGTAISLVAIRNLLGGFAEADSPFTVEDMLLRAAGCALDDVPAASSLPDGPVALETRLGAARGQLVFDTIRKSSLGPLRKRRMAALAGGRDQAALPAALSLRLLEASGIRPVTMPLLPNRAMRLVLAAGEDSAEALLCFDAAQVDEDVATEFLMRFKAYLEVPLKLLA